MACRTAHDTRGKRTVTTRFGDPTPTRTNKRRRTTPRSRRHSNDEISHPNDAAGGGGRDDVRMGAHPRDHNAGRHNCHSRSGDRHSVRWHAHWGPGHWLSNRNRPAAIHRLWRVSHRGLPWLCRICHHEAILYCRRISSFFSVCGGLSGTDLFFFFLDAHRAGRRPDGVKCLLRRTQPHLHPCRKCFR